MIADDIIATALEAVDTPFKHQGRVVGVGLDCAGLYVYVCQRLGVQHQDATCYPRTPFGGELVRQLDQQPCLHRIQKDEASKGDILIMRMSRSPQHIAFHAGDIDGSPYVLHASDEHGKVCLHRMDSRWFGRVVGAYRFEVNE
jgi:cell wall-associated NlpC family hydrolase